MRDPLPPFNVGMLDDQNYTRKSSFLLLRANVFNIERGAGDEYEKIQNSEILGVQSEFREFWLNPQKRVNHNHDFILFVHVKYPKKYIFPLDSMFWV